MTLRWKSAKLKIFEKLFFENHASLCRLVYRFVRDTDVSHDIVQEVFLKYWKKSEENPMAPDVPEAYLKRACINEALNYLKETERRTLRESSYAEEFGRPSDKNDRADADLIATETASNIHEAIDMLPPICRQVFLLSRYEYKSYNEIASILSISVNTVEKHIGKALSVLKKVLHKKGM
ncbi:MAG: RNA polymerase sigma-70 factor [Cyclobacteriaceae bacterium]|nr:RNA polymerase sigma-70 factor [Cyclobacteriaceae bacterium]